MGKTLVSLKIPVEAAGRLPFHFFEGGIECISGGKTRKESDSLKA